MTQSEQTLMIKSDFDREPAWLNTFEKHKPSNLKLSFWPEYGPKEEIDYALVWAPEAGLLGGLPNLKVIFSIGAGLDHLRGPGILPDGIPVVRMVDPILTAGMVEYAVYHTLHYHRHMPTYRRQQRDRLWREHMQVPAAERTVSILGLGVLGGAVASMLGQFGFNVLGWSRTAKNIAGVTSYHGEDGLRPMLERTDILICLLPLTQATEQIINAESLSWLPEGAAFINAGRGAQVDDEALLDALDSGQLSGASLDVFNTEPLPASHDFWRHPKVYLTPHVASMTLPQTSLLHVLDNISRFRQNLPLTDQADMQQGY